MTKWISIDTAVRRYHIESSDKLIAMAERGELPSRKIKTNNGYHLEVDNELVGERFPKRSLVDKAKDQSVSAVLGGFVGLVANEISEITKAVSSSATTSSPPKTNSNPQTSSKKKMAIISGFSEFRSATGKTNKELSLLLEVDAGTLSLVEASKPIDYPLAQSLVRGSKKISKQSGKNLPILALQAID